MNSVQSIQSFKEIRSLFSSNVLSKLELISVNIYLFIKSTFHLNMLTFGNTTNIIVLTTPLLSKKNVHQNGIVSNVPRAVLHLW